MSDRLTDLLDAETFVREAASEMKVLRERGASLTAARQSLDASTQLFLDAARDLHESEGLTRETGARLTAATDAVEGQVREATARGATELMVAMTRRFEELQRQLLESDREQREAFGSGVRGATRSLLDSAQTLSEATANITANTSLFADLGAREREQWQLSVAKALGDARARMESAGDTAQATADRLDAILGDRVSDFDGATERLLVRLAAVEEHLEQVRAQNRVSYVQQLRGELVTIRRTTLIAAVVQLILLAAVALMLALR